MASQSLKADAEERHEVTIRQGANGELVVETGGATITLSADGGVLIEGATVESYHRRDDGRHQVAGRIGGRPLTVLGPAVGAEDEKGLV
jgi:hypothetical protein